MSRFQHELEVIPTAAWVVAAILWVALGGGLFVLMEADRNPPPEIVRIFFSAFVPTVLAVYVLLVGYIAGDARRRGMRHVMWTLLAIFIPNGIGVILYFVLRDPMPVFCPRCGGAARPNFAYCAHCGGPVQPACPQCRKPVETAWVNCPYCGAMLRNSRVGQA
jgi:hypothetical protein